MPIILEYDASKCLPALVLHSWLIERFQGDNVLSEKMARSWAPCRNISTASLILTLLPTRYLANPLTRGIQVAILPVYPIQRVPVFLIPPCTRRRKNRTEAWIRYKYPGHSSCGYQGTTQKLNASRRQQKTLQRPFITPAHDTLPTTILL